MALPTIKNANKAPRVKEIANENTANTHAKPAIVRKVAGFIFNFECMSNMEPKNVAV